MASNSTKVKSLSKKLEAARHAYYETAEPIMSDDDFDKLVEELRALQPDHPFFKAPGPTPTKGKERLPLPMASLKKIKPDSWASWKPSDIEKGFVISEKLDGISALWCPGPKKLYLRGDGETGQNVSHVIPYIQGLQSKLGHWVVRGELISPSSEMPARAYIVRGELISPSTEVTGTLARNWVNGILHQDSPTKEDLSKIRFVAYQVLQPAGLTRSQQFSWLLNQGFECAWNKKVYTLSPEVLSSAFKERRSTSIYTCDGIVVGVDKIPDLPKVSEPDDAVAYKEVSDDQCKETKVVKVEWNASKTGTWIPRLVLEPVVIGSAKIQYCTAFHAKYVLDNKLGAGSVIKLRRSGDVIPIVDTVLVSSAKADMPPEGQWDWDSTKTHAVLKEGVKNMDVITKNLVHTVTAFGVEGFREATAGELCGAEITDLPTLLKTSKKRLQELLGNVLGVKLYDQLQEKTQSASEETWLLAAPCWPKGFGKSKLVGVYAVEPDVNKWGLKTMPAVKGLSADSMQLLKESVPEYLKWRTACGSKPVVKTAATAATATAVTNPVESKGAICMTGFRDAVLASALEKAGYTLADSVTKTTKALLVLDTSRETTKMSSAKKYSVPIVAKENAKTFFGL